MTKVKVNIVRFLLLYAAWKVAILASILRGNVKKNSIFVNIVQIEVDLPPSYLIFDKFIFDILLIMLTSLPLLEFWQKS